MNEEEKEKMLLFDLTKKFVNAHWRHYYFQYKGDIDDLVFNYYCEFLTPKGKEHLTLLERIKKKGEFYSNNNISFHAIVKQSVIRRLINSSIADSGERHHSSLDEISEDIGDTAVQFSSGLCTEEPIVIGDSFIEKVKEIYNKLSLPRKLEAFESLLHLSTKVVTTRPITDFIVNYSSMPLNVMVSGKIQVYECVHLTDKTIVAFNGQNKEYFDRLTGESRNRKSENYIPAKDLQPFGTFLDVKVISEGKEVIYSVESVNPTVITLQKDGEKEDFDKFTGESLTTLKFIPAKELYPLLKVDKISNF